MLRLVIKESLGVASTITFRGLAGEENRSDCYRVFSIMMSDSTTLLGVHCNSGQDTALPINFSHFGLHPVDEKLSSVLDLYLCLDLGFWLEEEKGK